MAYEAPIPVMGPGCASITDRSFTETVPRSFNEDPDYASYRQYVELWMNLTKLVQAKQGALLIIRMSGETKESAKMLTQTIV